jgi:F-type H+-transporting ATPase subunit b
VAFIVLFSDSIQLVPDGTLLVHVVILLLMVAVLGRTLYRPINRILEERERQTAGMLGQAERLLKETQVKLSHFDRSLRDARGNAYKLLENERTLALQEREKQLANIRDEIRSDVTQQRELIRRQTEQARQQLKEEAANNASEIGSRILGRSVR